MFKSQRDPDERNSDMAADAERWGQPEIAAKLRRGEGRRSELYQQARRQHLDEQARKWAETA